MNLNRSIRAGWPMLLPLALPALLGAQTTGRLAVGGGSATDERGIRSNAVTISPSVTFAQGLDARVTLGGNATFFQNDAWSLGGALGAHSRGAIGGGFAVALDADGDASRTSYDATFATAELVPSLEYTWSGLTLFGGVRGAEGYTAVTTHQQSLQGLPGTTQLVSDSRSLYAPEYGARLRILGASPTVGGQLMYREEPMHVQGVQVTDRTLTGALVAGSLTLVASAGHRQAVDETLNFGSASMEYEFAQGFAVDLSGGRYASNRLTGAAGGNYVSAGLSWSLGGHASHALPAPRGVGAPPPGVTRLSIRAPDADHVEIAGDWNDWAPVPAIRAENGVWYADLRIPPGQYRYAFRIDGRAWRVPEHAVAVDDGFGGKAAYVTVRDADADSHEGREVL
jgi:hypothetical protein